MKKPYITLEEALAAREEGRRSVKFLTEANGSVSYTHLTLPTILRV